MHFRHLAIAIADAIEAHYIVLKNILNDALNKDESDAIDSVWRYYAVKLTSAKLAADHTLCLANGWFVDSGVD